MLPAQGNIWQNPPLLQCQQHLQQQGSPPIAGNQGSSPPIMLYNPHTGTRVSYAPSVPPPPFFPNSSPIGTPMAPSSAVPYQMRAHEHQMPMSYLTPQTSPIPNSSPTSFWSSSAPLQGQQIGFMSSPGEQQMYEQFLLFQQHQERLRMAQMAASGFQGQQVQSFAPQHIGQIHSQVPGHLQNVQGVPPPQQEPRGQPLQEESILRRLIETDDRQAPQMNLQAPPQVQAAPPQEAPQVQAAPRPLPPGVRPYKGPWFPEEPEKKEKEPVAEKKISIKVEGHPAPPVSPVSLPDAITPQQLESVKEGPPPEQVAPPAENRAPRDPRISCCPSSIYYKPPRQAEQQERQVIPKDRAEEPVEPVQPPAPEKRVVQPTAAVPETMVEQQPKQLEGQRHENVQAQGVGHQKRAEGGQGADQAKKAPLKPRKTMPTVPPIIIKRKVRITETRPDDDHLQPCQEKLQKQKPPQPGENQQQKHPVEDTRQQQGSQAERPSEQQGPQGPQQVHQNNQSLTEQPHLQHLPGQEDLEIQEVRSDGLQDPRKVPCPKAKMKTPSELAAIKMEMMDYEDSERRQKMKQKKDSRRIDEENEDRENREQPSMFDLFGPDPLPTSPRARKRRSTESTDSEKSKKDRRSVDEEELGQLRISSTPPSTPSTLNAPMKGMSLSSTPAKDLPPWRSTTSEPYVPPQLTTLPVQLVQGEGDDTETIPAINENRDHDFDEEEAKSNIFERFQSCLNAGRVSKNVSNTSVDANMENSSTSSRSSEAEKINDVVIQPSNENIFGSMKQETTNKNNEEALSVPSHVCTGYYCEACEMMDLEETLRIAHLPRFRPNLQ